MKKQQDLLLDGKRTILSNGERGEVAMETEAGLGAAVALPRRVPTRNSVQGREGGLWVPFHVGRWVLLWLLVLFQSLPALLSLVN